MRTALFTLGVLFMAGTATGQKVPEYDTQVRWEHFEKGKPAGKVDKVDARLRDIKGKPAWLMRTKGQNSTNGPPTKGDRVVEANGTVWVVTEAKRVGQGEKHLCYAEKQPKP